MSLDPAKLYIYESLADEQDIRLLSVRPADSQTESVLNADPVDDIVEWKLDILHFSLRDLPPYETVSYTWGTTEQDQHLPLATGQYVPVTKTLIQAISRLAAESQTNLLWIDQVCIDQGNLQERNAQVLLMRGIYKCAEWCLIWTGEEDEATKYIELLAKATHPFVNHLPGLESSPNSDDYVSAGVQAHEQVKKVLEIALRMETQGLLINADQVEDLITFFQRPWFRRAWVFQEVVLSKVALFLAGSKRFGANELLFLASAVSQQGKKRTRQGRESQLSAESSLGFSYFRLMHIIRLEQAGGNRSPYTFAAFLAMMAGSCKSTDPRDLVYAFVGLLDSGFLDLQKRLISPDYALPVTMVYIDATRAIMEANQDLTILEEFWYAPESSSTEVALPSWVLDPSRKPTGACPIQRRPRKLFSASGSMRHRMHRQNDPSNLVTRGGVIDKVTLIATREPLDDGNVGSAVLRDFVRLDEIQSMFQKANPEKNPSKKPIPALNRQRLLKIMLTRDSDQQFLSDKDMSEQLQIYDEKGSLTFNEIGYTRFNSFTDLEVLSRCVFLSDQGRLGLAPSNTKPEDLICVLHGSRMPVILREKDAGVYTFVGLCYFEDSMFGEAITWTEEGAQEFVLV